LLSPIAVAAAPPYLLVASPTLPVTSTADLIRYAKEKPEGLTFGSSGVGAASHLSACCSRALPGSNCCTFPTRNRPAVTDLLGGRIDMMFAPGPVVQQFVQSGQLKALGVTDTQRSRFYPDVPTVSESVPGYESVGWFGLLAPPNTRLRLSKRSTRSLSQRWGRRNFATIWRRWAPNPNRNTGRVRRYINADVAKWSKLVKDNDVQLPGGK